MKNLLFFFILLTFSIFLSCAPDTFDGEYSLIKGACSKKIIIGSLGAEKFLIKLKDKTLHSTEILMDKKGNILLGKLGDKKITITKKKNNLTLSFNKNTCIYKK